MILGAYLCILLAFRCKHRDCSHVNCLPLSIIFPDTDILRFKRMSVRRFGTVDIDGLWLLRRTMGDYPRFAGFDEREDVTLVSEQWYHHVPGTEYLATNPMNVPGLTETIEVIPKRSVNVVFEPLVASTTAKDPFQALPPELRSMLLELLASRDVVKLRLCSKAFSQLPQTYFKHLIGQEMPWVWELNDTRTGIELKRDLDWHTTWNVPWMSEREFWAGGKKRARTADGQSVFRPINWQLKGLKNRRMIYRDISIILDMMTEARMKTTE